MPCSDPIRVYTPALGGRVRFWTSKDPAYWVEPYTGQTLPCGNCLLCREEYARQTAVRITHESTLWEKNAFLTLTYSDQHLPWHGGLEYKHLVLFWKRLRKQIGKLRYYAVGEYGDKTQRPHYHACIFGHDFTDDRIILRDTPHLLWTSPALQAAWGLGNVSVGTLNFATARYTAQYVVKKLRKKQQYKRIDEQTGELILLEQPRAFMSRNLGKNWWLQWHQQTMDHDHVIINGQPQKPPRAYDKWLTATQPQKMEQLKNIRKEKAITTTKARSRARAINARARLGQKTSTF